MRLTAVEDRSGNTIEKYEYSVYGDVRILAKENGETRTVSIIDNPYYFTGRRLDNKTGLYYYRARYYSPTLGRFLQTDPIGYGDGLNMYAYCGNNPIALVDPWGLAGDYSGYNYWSALSDAPAEIGKSMGRGAAATADGVIPFADPLSGAYANADGSVDGVFRFSRAMGSVARDATIAAGGAAAWRAVGPTMNVAVGQSGAAGTHVAYGTGSSWVHATGVRGFMTVGSKGAASFAANVPQLTGLPVLNSSAVLSAAGTGVNYYNCATAAASAYWSAGGAQLALGYAGYTAGMATLEAPGEQ